jgi:hypothetical protein
MLCPPSSCWSFPLARRPPRVGLEHLTIGWFMAALRRSPSSQVSRSVVVKSLFSYLAIWSEEPRLIDHCAFDKLGATRSLPSKSAHKMLLLMWFFRSYPANPQLHCERLYQLMRRFGRSSAWLERGGLVLLESPPGSRLRQFSNQSASPPSNRGQLSAHACAQRVDKPLAQKKLGQGSVIIHPVVMSRPEHE